MILIPYDRYQKLLSERKTQKGEESKPQKKPKLGPPGKPAKDIKTWITL